MNESKKFNTQKLVLLAIFTAIVILLQFFGSFIRFGQFSISLVLMPIAVGAALMGSLTGVWLGFVFGMVVLISGDANPFLMLNPAATILVVLLKGMLAGLAAGFVYKLLKNRNKTVAAIAAAVVCPVINTGTFIIGCYLFFLPALTQWGMQDNAASVTEYIFLGLIGANFLLEAGVNLILSPAIVRLIQYRYDSKEH